MIIRKKITLIAALCISLCAVAQGECEIKQEYANIFGAAKMGYGERTFIRRHVRTIDEENCFADLVNQNQNYLGYLQTNFSDWSNTKALMMINDSVALQDAFIQDLVNDTLFNKVMQRFTERFNSRESFVPDTVSMDDLLNIGAKFFSIPYITEEGYYAGKVCSGINGLKETESERNPHIEAFCFAAVIENYEGEKYNTYNELISGLKELYKINLGIDKEERLLRAQGALYMYMRNNSCLRELFAFEYNQRQRFLPFVLSK